MAILVGASIVACNKTDSVTRVPPSPGSTRATPVAGSQATDVSVANVNAAQPGSGDAAQTSIPPTPPEQLVLAEDSLTNPLNLIAGRIDTTVTLAAWLDSHPSDKIGVNPPVEQLEDKFCRAAHQRMRLGNRTIVRSALFDIVETPPGERAPTDTARAPRDFCDLRTMWLSTEVADSAAASELAGILTGQIDKLLGSHTDGVKMGGRGVGGWTDGRWWTGPGTTVVVAVAPPFEMEGGFSFGDEGPPPDSIVTPKGRRVVVAAYARNSGYEDIDRLMEKFRETPHERGRFLFRDADSAMALAALPAIAKDLKTVLAYVRSANPSDTLRNRAIDAVLLRAVKATKEIAPTLSPSRRAAALLATDIALYASAPSFDSEHKPPLQDSLAALGFTFTNASLDQINSNDRPWLWEAYNLDSLGRAGHIAFVELLGNGWTTKAACHDGEDQYRKIIEHGEAAINRGDTDPMVHYYVGSAYKTIFDAASAARGGEYIGQLNFDSRAEAARLRAIAHYSAALATLTDRDTGRDVWNRLMRLMLKRNGEQPEYICFYD